MGYILFSCHEISLARKVPSKNKVNISKDLLALLSNAAVTTVSKYQNPQNEEWRFQDNVTWCVLGTQGILKLHILSSCTIQQQQQPWRCGCRQCKHCWSAIQRTNLLVLMPFGFRRAYNLAAASSTAYREEQPPLGSWGRGNIRLFSLKSPASSSSSLIKSKPKDACIFDQGAGNKSYAFTADAWLFVIARVRKRHMRLPEVETLRLFSGHYFSNVAGLFSDSAATAERDSIRRVVPWLGGLYKFWIMWSHSEDEMVVKPSK